MEKERIYKYLTFSYGADGDGDGDGVGSSYIFSTDSVDR